MMIRDHNRRQVIRALGHFVVAILATLFTFGFWFWLLLYGNARGSFPVVEEHTLLIALCLVGISYLAGFFHAWRLKRSQRSDYTDLFQSRSFVAERGLIEGHVNSYAANVAQSLLTLFYAGPTRLIMASQSLRARVRFSPVLESELEQLHSRIQSVGKWHDARRYLNESNLLRHLVQMEQVDFSPHKGRIKAA
ncbi:MAG: hypothetical protein AAF357_08900 [Verrucomicrobiota bacterium]